MSTSGNPGGRLLIVAALGVASLAAATFLLALRRRTRPSLFDFSPSQTLQSQDKVEIAEQTVTESQLEACGNKVTEVLERPLLLKSLTSTGLPAHNDSIGRSQKLSESVDQSDCFKQSRMTTPNHQSRKLGSLLEGESTMNNDESFGNDANSCTANTVLSDELNHKLNIQDGAKSFVNGGMNNSNSKLDPKNKSAVKTKFDKTKLMPTKNGLKSKESLTTVSTDSRGYKNAESPSGSTNSEGSADSGRATGGPNCSPFDNHYPEYEPMPVYEFEVPNTLVGLIIGVQGKTISELSNRAQVRILIRPHHTPSRYDTHQICSIDGKRGNINKCLHMIRYRFPQTRFPDLNLQPIFPPNITPDPQLAMPGVEPTTLSLPVGVPCEVFVCAVVDAGHFFVQLPTHPTFSSLETLDIFTMSIYSRLNGIPVLPKPCSAGLVCIAPTANGWFRAITLHHEEEDDTVIVRLADYGGFLRLPRAELRQIRSDLTSLPMQAIECYLAHVQPVDGTAHWSQEAYDMFTKLCACKLVQAEIKGHNKDSNVPYVELYAIDEHKKAQRVDIVLLELGYAKPADPTKMVPIAQGNPILPKSGPIYHNPSVVSDLLKPCVLLPTHGVVLTSGSSQPLGCPFSGRISNGEVDKSSLSRSRSRRR